MTVIDPTPDTRGWQAPQILDPSDPTPDVPAESGRLSHAAPVIIDPIEEIREELEDASHEGVWVHFPWSNTLVRYPDRDAHFHLRTYRNRDLITPEEQQKLRTARIAVFGLSVGSNIVDQFAQIGLGGAFLISDYDRLSPTNLNRLRATMSSVGMTKVDILARKLSEVDPWIEQVHLPDGFDENTEAVLNEFKPDILIEEVDDLPAKAKLRLWAAKTGTPLLMAGDYGEKSVLDVERHDLATVRPFNGQLSTATFERLLTGDIDDAEARQMLIKLVGVRNISVRLLRSGLNLDGELAGTPQLGSTASAGATLASVAARAILTGEPLKSGRYSNSPRRQLKLGNQATFLETVRTIREARKSLGSS